MPARKMTQSTEVWINKRALVSSSVCAFCHFISLSCPSLHPYCLIPFINCFAFSPRPFSHLYSSGKVWLVFYSFIFAHSFFFSLLSLDHISLLSSTPEIVSHFSYFTPYDVCVLPSDLILCISLSHAFCFTDPLPLHSGSALAFYTPIDIFPKTAA